MSEPLPPQELSKQATTAYNDGEYAIAAGLFAQAAESHARLGNDLDAVEMQNNQSVALLQAGDAANALAVVRGTSALFKDAGDIRRAGFALGNEAAALQALERFDEALTLYHQSADLLEQAGEDQMRATVMHSISALQLKTGKYIDAVASMQNGLAGVEKPSIKQKLMKALLRFRP